MPGIRVGRADVRLSGRTGDQMRAVLAKYGLSMSMPIPDGALLVAHCSKTKGKDLDEAVPKDFYISPRNLRFYAACNGRPYGILSDKYGLHMHDEAKPFYDVHPSTVSERVLWELGDKIAQVCARRDVRHLHYIVSPPTTAVPYLIMLLASGIPFSMASKL